MSFLRFAYKKILKPILFRFDPEVIHNVFVKAGELLGRTSFGRWVVDKMYGYHGPDASRIIDGIRYPTPTLLAAGFDYNGRLTQILKSVGFGGVEVGSVTARPCKGNEPPRLRRAIRSKSLIVYKGLKNEGVDKVIERHKKRPPQKGLVVGMSIAMTNDEGSATLEGSINDYVTSLTRLSATGVGDYYTVNISCPNVHGGENFTNPGRLEKLLEALSEVEISRPIYAKMPINIDWETFKKLVDQLRAHNFNGVIIGNLNKDYDALAHREEAPDEYRGGLSGEPCRKPSTELIRRTREYVGPDFTIMACGGVLSVEAAMEKFDAGADLIQLISGMIFEGPHLMKEIARATVEREEMALPEGQARLTS